MATDGSLRAWSGERALPAGTTMRFVLLVVLMLASGVSLVPVAFTAAGLNKGASCLSAAGVGTGEVPPGDVLRSAAYRACVDEHGMVSWWVGPAVPGVLVVLACGLFFVLPLWKARGNRVVSLEAVDHDGQILRHLTHLAQATGLKRMPRVVVDPSAASTGAAVFGRTGRPTVCLHGGLLARRTTVPEDFDAVLLHELAHIRNRDVTLTYATVALWRTFIAAVLVPYAVGFAILVFNSYAPETPPYEVLLPAWRALVLPVFMTVVVYLARSDVLRSRELQADLTAARWGANPRVWGFVEPAPPARVLPGALRSFTEVWRTHPRWDLRREALADSTPLFEVPGLLMFLTGAAVVMVNGQLWFFAGSSHRVGQWEWNVAMALPCAVLVTGIAGTVLWRSTVHRLLNGRRRLSGAWAGLWLGIGMTVGELFGNRIAIFRWLPGEPVVLLLLALAGLTFTWWVTQCSHLWVTAWRGRTIRTPMMLTLAGACLALCAWFWWWQNYGVILANVPGLLTNVPGAGNDGLVLDPTGENTAILTTAERAVALLSTTVAVPLALPAVAVLWLLPLLAWTVHPLSAVRRRDTAPDPDKPLIPDGPLPPLRRTLSAGLFGGVACWAGIVGIKAHMHAWQPPVRLRGVAGALLYQYGMSAALLAGAAVAALTASLLAGRYRLIAALAAAHTAALAGYSGVWALTASDGCLQGISTFLSTCGWRPAGTWQAFQYLLGMLLILVTIGGIVAAAAISVARRAFRRSTHPAASAQAGYESRRLNLRRLAVGALCAGAIGVPAALLSSPELHGNSATAPGRARPVTHPRFAAQEASVQAEAWYSLGGLDLLARYDDNLGKLRALGPEAQKSSDGAALITSRLPVICTEFGKIAKDADAYFPAPAPQIQPSWKTFITQAAKGSEDCLTGLRRNNAALLTAGVKEINQATRAADTIKAWITSTRTGRP
ncbi:M48 family metallopeptidase [Streptomyces iconiensis]|uniref:M56 family metallopeptidase n=1 Tax=Streptomyces iconiensis TaxID=1384038 RepID=A0ABT7A2W6_9ACTN|nr:M56 family metallopeptidase [Streptomyces iconiensis]MDJ1135414.1 M56 family metallopeptidase [Streptomyces iconiensis]